MPGIKNFPTLYCQNEDGSTQEWTIWVENGVGLAPNVCGVICTKYGRVGGAIQETRDVVSEGKNAGKKNATTAVEQAIKEAKSKWEKKLKSGYHQEKKAAEKGQIDTSFIAGGVAPMLAQKYRDHANKMPFPALAQPKLDGVRCIAVIKKGQTTLWSRTRKAITGVPHIIHYLNQMFAGKDAILDGELYHHDMEFETIISFTRQQTAKPGHEQIEYHVYDTIILSTPNSERADWLASNIVPNHPRVKLVKTENLADAEDLKEYFSECIEDGYEGCMVRNPKGTYEIDKRSYNLLKVKEFDDAEFEIVGTEEGRGKMAGKAIFVCKTDKGDTFNVKMQGSLADLSKYLNNKKVLGKKLTVRYQGYTNGNVPRFPVGVAIRDYE